MTDVVILRNGKPVETRLLMSDDAALRRAVNLSGWRWGAEETTEARARHLHVVLLEPPEPGDDLTYRDLAPEYDKVYVRWSQHGTTYIMRIEN